MVYIFISGLIKKELHGWLNLGSLTEYTQLIEIVISSKYMEYETYTQHTLADKDSTSHKDLPRSIAPKFKKKINCLNGREVIVAEDPYCIIKTGKYL